MNIEKNNQTIDIRLPYKRNKKWSKTFLICSDVHFDNPKCNRNLFFKHLEEARNRDAHIITNGDFFCAMQGKFDPRRSKKNVRPEHNVDNYLNVLVDDTADQLEKYLDLFAVIGYGNHETAILKNCEFDLLEAFAKECKYRGQEIAIGGYHGFIRFRFGDVKDGGLKCKTLYYHHGKFGGTVTKGVLGVSRHASYVPDADIIITGHTHDHWLLPLPRFRLKRTGEIVVENQLHLKTGTYKEEFTNALGWAIERIAIPKNLGSWWITFSYDASVKDVKVAAEMAV